MNDNQIVGEVICPDCGKPTAVKVNKNGCLYIYCTNITNDETGERCGHRRSWGRVLSRKYQREHNIEVVKNGITGIADIKSANRNVSGHDNIELKPTGSDDIDTSIWN